MMMITSLPTELCFSILKYTAMPSFVAVNTTNPYSSALALCLVSKAVRLIVIPELLHTIFLPGTKHVVAFIDALRMQKVYAQEGSDLHIDYAAQVHCIWMEEMPIRNPSWNYFLRYLYTIDFSLFAPVVLAAKSLRVDYSFMSFLDGCLEHAWNAGIHSDITHKSSPLPWSVEILTLCHPGGDLASYHHDTSSRYSFLDFISDILVTEELCPTESTGHENVFYYKTPERPYISDTPWANLKNLRFISFGLPHQHRRPSGIFVLCGSDLRVELLTVPNPLSLPLDHCAQQTPSTCSLFPLNHDGSLLSPVDCRATVTCSTTVAHSKRTCLVGNLRQCSMRNKGKYV